MTSVRRHDEETERQPEPPLAGAQRRVLVFWEHGSAARALPARGSVTFGRALDCDVPIDHVSVSRRHATLHLGDEMLLEDLRSSNGTRVGKRKVGPGERVRIAPGELIELGSAMLVVQGPGEVAPESTDGGRGLAPGTILRDPVMQQVQRLLTMVAPTTMSVLVRGETGVGKEVVAETIHRLSPRAAKPLVCLNCAAVPESLLETELFGYERGAFTGATAAMAGHLEAASGGTFFLDEVGEMPLAAQAKLLRAVESRQVTRVGGRQPIPIDVRFVAATHRDLDALVAKGSFRQDLYFRLNGISIRIPPLRERISEIAPLAELFLARAAGEMGAAAIPISPEAMDLLEKHAWPGDIRELKNVVGQAAMFSRDAAMVRPEHLPAELHASRGPVHPPPSRPPANRLRDEVDAFERQRIADALEQCSGNQTRAARLLGISRRTLVSRLASHGLGRPRKG
jgi:DNA-binding NtrC family response regulator